jgi:hypothetical protein
MLRLMLDEIRDGASSLELECNPEEINLEFEGVDFIGKIGSF